MSRTEPLVLIVNPGSTSTKLALYGGEREVAGGCVRHESEELKDFLKVADQRAFRTQIVQEFLRENKPQGQTIDCCIGRGGLLAPLESGVYEVNESMLRDLREGRYGEHGSNLGALIVHDLAKDYGCPALIADPVVVDEMEPLARYSGHPKIPRKSIFHALNQKAVARRACREFGLSYDHANLIVAHLGGGVSVGAHRGGRVIDVNNALDGDGPFGPERAGGLPAGDLISLVAQRLGTCSPESPEGQSRIGALRKELVGRGGVVAYWGTTDIQALELAAATAKEASASEILKALAYQIAKEVASHGATLAGKVDRIVLTGGLAYSEFLIRELESRLRWLAPLSIYPGEGEMEALAENALAYLRGNLPVRVYKG